MIDNPDERLVVDSRAGDNSSVFHVDMLDDSDKWLNRFRMPWLFDTDEYPIQAYETENEAAAAQRMYRLCKGFDSITGDAK